MNNINKNVYITNFWYASNYGANLTAYALYKMVSKYCNNVFLLNNLKNKDKIVYQKSFAKKFIEKYCKIRNYEKEGDAILITGSDQVFNPNCEPYYAKDHFLDFADINDKKVSFSASFGGSKEKFLKENSKEMIDRIKKSLKSFDFVSVRENSGVEICKDILEVDAEWIIDPVFSLEVKDYEELIKNSTKDYSGKTVSYMINNKIETYNGAKIIELFHSNESVENWLNAIHTCKLFITNSFHGVCFAIIFNKPFICIVNSEIGSARYDSLFELLNIENQIIHSKNGINGIDSIFKIDYQSVNKKIEQERGKSLNLLKLALDMNVKNIQEKSDIRLSYLEEQVLDLAKRDSLKYQLNTCIWETWLNIYHNYLPKSIKTIIRFIRK